MMLNYFVITRNCLATNFTLLLSLFFPSGLHCQQFNLSETNQPVFKEPYYLEEN